MKKKLFRNSTDFCSKEGFPVNPFKKLFHPRHDLTSYLPSLIRLALGLSAVVLSIVLRQSYPFEWKILNIACSALLILIGLCGAFQIYMILCEISFTFDNRASGKLRALTADEIRALPYKLYSLDEIMKMVERDPLLELSIISHDRLICITIDSDSRMVQLNWYKSQEEFFNKRYSIENDEFTSPDDFRAALLAYAENGHLAVHDIDQLVQK